jgi:predicted permease
MRFHVEQETANNIRLGMPPQEARREALKAFGGVDRFAEESRDQRTGTRLTEFAVSWLDWKLGFRMLARYPALSLISGFTLAAAIGVAAGLFEFSLMELSPRLPFERGDRIVRIENWDVATSEIEPRAGYDLRAWQAQLKSIGQLGAYRTVDRNLITSDGRSEPIEVAEISASAFVVTGVPPLRGRVLIPADEQAGAANVVVIGHDVWQARFQGDEDIIGRTIRFGRGMATVIGVMPEGFAFPRDHQAWLPLRLQDAAPGEGPGITVFGRLEDGVTLQSAESELRAIGARLAAANPVTHAQLRPRVLPFAALDLQDRKEIVGDVLLINLLAWVFLIAACANVTALMFARTALRESEIVVRNALGATRAHVLGQLFIESLVLTITASAAGLFGAWLALRFIFRKFSEGGNPPPFWVNADFEPLTLLYTILLALVGAGLVSLLPALRVTGKRVRAGLVKMGAGGTNIRFGGVWSAIIVLQVASAVFCLPIVIDYAREAFRDVRTRAAFPAQQYLTFEPGLDREFALGTADEVTDAALQAQRGRVIDELARRLENEAGIEATFASALPGQSQRWRYVEAQREGGAPFAIRANLDGRVKTTSVDIGFFDAFRVPLVSGRGFRFGDLAAGSNTVIINESLAKNIGSNPIGIRLRYVAERDDNPGPWYEVVGVVRDLDVEPTNRGEADFLFFPASAAHLEELAVAVRVSGDPWSFAPRLRALALQVEPGLRLYDLLPLEEVIRRRDFPFILAHAIGIAVVLLAILLSAASLYALMSVAVARRTREIAIRVALGASRRGILSAVLRRAALQVGAGLFIGNLLVSALVTLDPLSMLGVSASMALVGLFACLVPARRSLRVQPTVALKEA